MGRPSPHLLRTWEVMPSAPSALPSFRLEILAVMSSRLKGSGGEEGGVRSSTSERSRLIVGPPVAWKSSSAYSFGSSVREPSACRSGGSRQDVGGPSQYLAAVNRSFSVRFSRKSCQWWRLESLTAFWNFACAALYAILSVLAFDLWAIRLRLSACPLRGLSTLGSHQRLVFGEILASGTSCCRAETMVFSTCVAKLSIPSWVRRVRRRERERRCKASLAKTVKRGQLASAQLGLNLVRVLSSDWPGMDNSVMIAAWSEK